MDESYKEQFRGRIDQILDKLSDPSYPPESAMLASREIARGATEIGYRLRECLVIIIIPFITPEIDPLTQIDFKGAAEIILTTC